MNGGCAGRTTTPHEAVAGFTVGLRPGDWVSMHWGCVCDRLGPAQLSALRRYSARQLGLANVAEPLRLLGI